MVCLLVAESQTPAAFFLCVCRNLCRTLGVRYTDVWSSFKRVKLVTRKMYFIYFIFGLYVLRRGFGGLGVACWLLVPKFLGSNPAEAVGFLRAKKSSARLLSEGK